MPSLSLVEKYLMRSEDKTRVENIPKQLTRVVLRQLHSSDTFRQFHMKSELGHVFGHRPSSSTKS